MLEPIVDAKTAEAEQALQDYVWIAHARQLVGLVGLGLEFELCSFSAAGSSAAGRGGTPEFSLTCSDLRGRQMEIRD